MLGSTLLDSRHFAKSGSNRSYPKPLECVSKVLGDGQLSEDWSRAEVGEAFTAA